MKLNQENPAVYGASTLVLDSQMTLQEIEKAAILQTLQRLKFNRTHTARALGIGIRTLQRKIKQYRSVGPIMPKGLEQKQHNIDASGIGLDSSH